MVLKYTIDIQVYYVVYFTLATISYSKPHISIQFLFMYSRMSEKCVKTLSKWVLAKPCESTEQRKALSLAAYTTL